MKKKTSIKYYIGIDEVGRGPLAGPVTIGAFMVSAKDLKEFKKKVKSRDRRGRDSKKMIETEREEWFKYFYDLKTRDPRQSGDDDGSSFEDDKMFVDFVTTSISAKKIDEKGISWCIKKAITTSLSKLKIKPEEVKVYLDGSLKAPEEYTNQETIIKGDEKNDLIAAASIVAKVTRDKFMKNLSKKFPEYGFEENKGYGTLAHRKLIKKHGVCNYHRVSFCKNII